MGNIKLDKETLLEELYLLRSKIKLNWEDEECESAKRCIADIIILVSHAPDAEQKSNYPSISARGKR